jgi:hypothetical protein
MAYVTGHFRKLKTSVGMGNVANHNSRASVMDDTGGWKDGQPPKWMKHPERIHLNEGQAGKRDDSIARRWGRIVEEANLKRKPQKNAAPAVEINISASPGHFKKASEWKQYLHDALGFVKETYGEENVLQWNMHYDEKTPHLHAVMVPIIRDPDKGNRYTSSEFSGGPEGLEKFQDLLYEKVGKKYGLERGERGSEARHTDQDEWKRQLQKKEKELKELTHRIDQFKTEKMAELDGRKKTLDLQEAKIETEKRALKNNWMGDTFVGLTQKEVVTVIDAAKDKANELRESKSVKEQIKSSKWLTTTTTTKPKKGRGR